MDLKLSKKKIFITGGTGSVGMAIVEVFSKSGGAIYFQFYNNEKRALRLEREFKAKSFKIDFNTAYTLPDYNFDVIINNAGINISKGLSHEISDAEWKMTINVNLNTPFQIIRKYLPYMIENKWGRIINISSIYGIRASSNNLPYNASKHGLSGLTKTIAKEFAQSGITCNEICPGPIESELMNRIAKDKEKLLGISTKNYLEDICKTLPAGRMAFPKEIANIAVFLASDYSNYINGISIPVDGALIA